MLTGFPPNRPQVLPSYASTFTSDHEKYLAEWLKGRKIVLEVGSGIGVITEYLARHADLVYACDPWTREKYRDGKSEQIGEHPFDTFCVNCWHHRLKIIPIHGSVEEVLPWMAKSDIRLDAICLDGAHQFEGLREHIKLVQAFYPDVEIIGDDYMWTFKSDMPVFRAVQSVLSDGFSLEEHGQMWKLIPNNHAK